MDGWYPKATETCVFANQPCCTFGKVQTILVKSCCKWHLMMNEGQYQTGAQVKLHSSQGLNFYVYPTWLIQEGDHHGRRGFGHCCRGESGLEMLRKKKKFRRPANCDAGFLRVSQIDVLFFNGFLWCFWVQSPWWIRKRHAAAARWNDCWSHSTLTCFCAFWEMSVRICGPLGACYCFSSNFKVTKSW